MNINSPMQEISAELFTGNSVESTADRRRSVTSDPIGNSTGKINRGISKTSVVGNQTNGGSSPSLSDVNGAVNKLNQLVQSQQTNVSFSVDKDANTTVIKVFNNETGELIKQFPPEEILAMKEKINEQVGLLYDSKV